MKKICSLLLAVSLLLTAMSFPAGATAQEQEGEKKSYSCYTLDAAETILGDKELTDNVNTAVIYELGSDTMLYTLNPDQRIEPASLVKVMTCLIAVEQGNMDDAVTIRGETIESIPSDAANVSLQADEVLTMEQLLYCMMVNSANDAAAVIAEHIAGSQERFVEIMNEYALELGCTDTHFTNVHGLYDREQYSTTRDLAKILKKAVANELFCHFFGTEYYTIPETNKSGVRYLLTSNYLLSKEDVEIYYDERVTGGRTGITQDYARSLAVAAQSGNMSLICVSTGSHSKIASNGYLVSVFGGYQEVSAMLDACFDGYYLAQVVYEGQTVTQQPVDNGDCDVVLGSKNTAYAVVPVSTKLSDLTYRLVSRESLVAPIKAGQYMTGVDIWLNDDCVAEAELYAMNDVRVQNQTAASNRTDSNVTAQPKPNTSGTSWGLIVVLVIVLAGLIVLFPRFAAMLRKKQARNRARKNQRNRRKSR